MENILFQSLIFHFIGDYLLQNDWMAINKTKKFSAAFIHVFVYSILFMFISSFTAWLVIFVTHFFIDRYRLAVLWVKFINWNWKSKNYGFDAEKPAFLSIWLLIIIDNVLHIIINSLAIIYL